MAARTALVTGTVLSLAAASAWSLSAAVTIGSPAPLHLTASPVADYAALAAAPTASGPGLLALTAVIYAACLIVSGLRARRRARRAPARELELDEEWPR